MSGLEKFQANSAWRAKVKKLLFMQRTLTPSSKTPVQSDRFSLDLTEDLQVFIEGKTVSFEEQHLSHSTRVEGIQNTEEKMFEIENDENKPINVIASVQHDKRKPEKAYYESMFEDKQQTLQWQRSSDDSFMALEKMCDKTASDPNSTLFQYIHSADKELIVEDAKKRSGNDFKTPCKKELQEIDEEAKSLQRLLYDLCVQEQKQLEIETPLKGIDVTQLEDIEAPSKLWDTTILGDTTLQTSPIKMVGLLRPSTIIEECDEEDDFNNASCVDGDVSSHVSFQSAVKTSETSATSYYDTAHETTDPSTVSKDSNTHEKNVSKELEDLDASLELIQLDKTLAAPQQQLITVVDISSDDLKIVQNTKNQSPSPSSDESVGVIELLSDEESEELIASHNRANITVKDEFKYECDPVAEDNNNPDKYLCKSLYTSSDLKSTESDELENSFENDKENCGEAFDESGEQSMHFNDTMEEVEYMMKKGMQYMAATASPNVGLNIQTPMVKKVELVPATMTVKPLKEKERTFTYSPKKQNSNYSSPAKKALNVKPTAIVTGTKAKQLLSSPRRTPQSSAQKNKRFEMDLRPVPKFELFKRPVSAIPTRLKEPTGSKQFSHIVSPVGAYMKKTATTPLMTNLKQRTDRPDVHNATVFRELEQETKVYQPKFALKVNTGTKTSSLPKKAYISSEFKHIVDERTPVTIPGGKKIQKYLENAMLPTVVRHEGKLKMSANQVNRNETASKASFGNTTQRNNGSLANLSLMSGDISVYTMKDARKF
ncbi:PREDICTED: uncharacterized protein LOC108965460 isoform X1 [Bactrocera latifrons]|uniref:Uncharacterized protein n=2 Tax=Bactrocera latifrons TaxID=174628 RepID=A0A0K8V952_BACLA|nr:PREDICTED: uncharacterized protein LOC108965460 isoform X1 [Bactrocera latifrons]